MILVAIKNGFLFLNLALTGIASVKRHSCFEIPFPGLDSCLNRLAAMPGCLLVGHFGFFFSGTYSTSNDVFIFYLFSMMRICDHSRRTRKRKRPLGFVAGMEDQCSVVKCINTVQLAGVFNQFTCLFKLEVKIINIYIYIYYIF